jgi:tetratricopeptide (TPR) repeat protein
VVEGPAVLRLVVERNDRKEMLKALRILEWAPDNRRPFVVVESAFTSEQAFALRAASALEAGYEKVREGLAEDGLTIPVLAPAGRPVTIDRLVAQLRLAADGVSRALDGLVFVVVPETVAEQAPYAAFVERLAPVSNGTTLRVCVLDHASLRSKGPGQACFAIDHDALLAFLKELKPNRSKGPPSSAPQLSPPQKAALEKELKRRIPSSATGDELRTLLLDAGKAIGDGQFKTAVRKFRAARMLCHLSGLTQDEAATSIALGSAALAAQDNRGALAAYQTAKQIALAGELPVLAAQAELGIAGVHWSMREIRAARASYAEVAKLSESMPALRLEAMRMEAECLILEGQPVQAIAKYREILQTAEGLEPDVRHTTPFMHAGQSLAKLLSSHGQAGAAHEVEAHVARLSGGKTAPGAQEARA